MGAKNSIEVKGDNDYFFFSSEQIHNYFPDYRVDEIALTTNSNLESNSIHIIFSDKPYYKPILNDVVELEDGYLFPKSLSYEEFAEWLSINKSRISEFQEQTLVITIEKE